MIIVQITGGLGNQLFQYCSAKSLAIEKKVPLFLDLSYYTETGKTCDLLSFNISAIPADTKVLHKFLKRNIVKKLGQRLIPPYKRDIFKERFFHFDPYFFKSNEQVFLKGLRQSEKYFINNKTEIKKELALVNPLRDVIIKKGAEMRGQNSISVHIRRGDYLTKVALDVLGLLNMKYYQSALEIIAAKITDQKIYYFTDDPEWVEKELLPLLPGEIISGNVTKNHLEDFYLMSQCRHNIIANSSFSWWAAWLNNNPDKIVIAPKKWFNKGPKDTQDLIPESWITI